MNYISLTTDPPTASNAIALRLDECVPRIGQIYNDTSATVIDPNARLVPIEKAR